MFDPGFIAKLSKLSTNIFKVSLYILKPNPLHICYLDKTPKELQIADPLKLLLLFSLILHIFLLLQGNLDFTMK